MPSCRGSAAGDRPRKACTETALALRPARPCAPRRDSHPRAPTSVFCWSCLSFCEIVFSISPGFCRFFCCHFWFCCCFFLVPFDFILVIPLVLCVKQHKSDSENFTPPHRWRLDNQCRCTALLQSDPAPAPLHSVEVVFLQDISTNQHWQALSCYRFLQRFMFHFLVSLCKSCENSRKLQKHPAIFTSTKSPRPPKSRSVEGLHQGTWAAAIFCCELSCEICSWKKVQTPCEIIRTTKEVGIKKQGKGNCEAIHQEWFGMIDIDSMHKKDDFAENCVPGK